MGPQPEKWYKGDTAPGDVKEEKAWAKNGLCHMDVLAQEWFLKARIGVGLEHLAAVLPEYSEKDLVVVNRRNKGGTWRSELWTARDFAPYDFMVAPVTSICRETHLTNLANAVVGLPKHGSGAHPSGKSLAMDGKSRTLVAKKGSLDDTEHLGGLFWIIGRTSIQKEANLEHEQVPFDLSLSFCLPHQKKRKTHSSWCPSDLPAIPVLTNKKALKAHTMLLAYLVDKK